MSVFPYRDRFEVLRGFPVHGRPRGEVLAEVAEMSSTEDCLADQGQISGSIYSGDHEHYAFLNQVYGYFSHANVLQRDVYPSATRFEGEIVAMAADLFHAAEPIGVVTSGGSESLMNPLLAYREWGRERGIERPNIVMPSSAHPAIVKGGHYFGVEIRRAPLTEQFVGDTAAIAERIDGDTVAIFASAGSYPHGTIDPIAELGELAAARGINLHVDGCLGGFILGWGADAGVEVPPFDFRVPGVTSLSADTHKFGFSLKGSSVLLYRDAAMRRRQYFKVGDWSGGLYVSPGMSGSRSGGIIAATWAAMVTLGRDGYTALAKEIFAAARRLRQIVTAHPELRVLGDPLFNVAFTTTEASGLDIFHVNDALAEQGWRMNGLQAPPAVHLCITVPQTRPGVLDRFAAALDVAVAAARERVGEPAHSGATYGSSGPTVPLDQLDSALDYFLDTCCSVPSP